MVLPFVQIAGNWHVIINWSPGMASNLQLVLRPLTESESEWLEPEMENVYFELWARLFPDDNAIAHGFDPPDEDI